jgi:RHS repeat-associated protein
VLAAADRDGLVLERYSYDDFGRPETRTETYGAGFPAGRNAHLFTGRRWDTTSGLYDYRTRWYDPSPGRFISRDTIGIWGDPANLGNPYTYVANNPATWVDPWGRWSVWAPWTWGDPTPAGHTWWGFGNPQARPWNFLREHVRTFSTWWEEGWVNGSLNGQISRIPGNHCIARTVMWGALATSAVAAGTAGARIAWELAANFGLAGYQEVAENATLPESAPELTGQTHHGISQRIHKELELHPNLKGVYQVRDPRFAARAKESASHRGYQQWHRNLDTEVSSWVRNHPNATPQQFENYLHQRYSQPDLQNRFPSGL